MITAWTDQVTQVQGQQQADSSSVEPIFQRVGPSDNHSDLTSLALQSEIFSKKAVDKDILRHKQRTVVCLGKLFLIDMYVGK